jgi:hypothetical protein
VRFREQGRVRNYALFLDGNQIVDDRFGPNRQLRPANLLPV